MGSVSAAPAASTDLDDVLGSEAKGKVDQLVEMMEDVLEPANGSVMKHTFLYKECSSV
ncbi:hypothetical protein RvY_11605 [Ramazzottius varieornatus]|uniref:Uncharacterized protein n=1 Tax=Ramazzottius varieornatus TaxID=947166 RepID=A0A1D1VQH3_RAMVA|nr:hypothetical protein RvY_11605 [Ramazzottius varieornatus]